MNNIKETGYTGKLILITLFAVAFAYVEAAIVVYLRQLFYAGGFTFPLKKMPNDLILIEVVRESATLLMLAAIALLTGRRRWDRFGYFLIAFGVWDIFYYVWLKAAIGWPASLTDWDILFLIPVPWIGPVLAPVAVAVLMVVTGILISRRVHIGADFKPGKTSWILAVPATALILFSFMRDLDAGFHQQPPQPYWYSFLTAGLALYTIAFVIGWRNSAN